MKRRGTPMTWIKPKRNKYAVDAEGSTVELEGCISQVKYPKVLESYTGRAVVVLAGRTVIGNLPFLDTRFIYKLVCRVSRHPKYGTQYEIVDFQDVPFVPAPLNFASLKMMLVSEHGMQEFFALEYVDELQRLLGAPSLMTPVDPTRLVRLQSPEWVVRLCDEQPVFKYEYLSQLARLWEPRALARLPFTTLTRLAEQLRSDPTVFCFAWKNTFPVPEVRWEKLAALEVISGQQLEERFKSCVSAYGRVSRWLQQNSRLTFTDMELIGLEPEARSYAINQQIFTPIQERVGEGNREKRWYTRSDLELLRDLKHRLGDILAAADDGPLKQSPPRHLNRLNNAQRAAYDAVLGVNMVMVLGDAGTGKTEVGRYIAGRFKRKAVLPVACYGRVAAQLQAKYGRGFTIHKVLTHIDKQTVMGTEFAEHAQVLIIDEISTLTLSLFVRLLRALPKLVKIVMLGDEKQMPPVERGAILEAMIAKYRNTKAVHRLTEIMRLDAGSRILISNFRKIAAGQTDLDIGDALNSEHPFVLVPRVPVPREAEGRAEGVEALQQSLRSVLDRFPAADVQILTQKNSVREELNHAIFNLSQNQHAAGQQYARNTFYVGEKIMFTENNYGDVEGREQTRSTAVMNGEVRTVVSIYDVDPFAENAEQARTHEVSSTVAPKINASWHRMMQFDDGGRINLRHYQISNISKGSASTVAMAQGSEYPVCVFYIHDRISHTLTVRELYTALTRAKQRVVVIGQPGELERIIRQPYEQPESPVLNWLPELN